MKAVALQINQIAWLRVANRILGRYLNRVKNRKMGLHLRKMKLHLRKLTNL
jgi:hypothetical protein